MSGPWYRCNWWRCGGTQLETHTTADCPYLWGQPRAAPFIVRRTAQDETSRIVR